MTMRTAYPRTVTRDLSSGRGACWKGSTDVEQTLVQQGCQMVIRAVVHPAVLYRHTVAHRSLADGVAC
jgi:hypothetical protein